MRLRTERAAERLAALLGREGDETLTGALLDLLDAHAADEHDERRRDEAERGEWS